MLKSGSIQNGVLKDTFKNLILIAEKLGALVEKYSKKTLDFILKYTRLSNKVNHHLFAIEELGSGYNCC